MSQKLSFYLLTVVVASAMAPISESTPEHIPAWKKIGLKLKYANEELPIGESSASKIIVTNGKKRKAITESNFAVDVATADSHTKKSKKSKSTPGEALANVNVNAAIAILPRIAPSTVEPNPINRRKSVTFTPETKTQDGESVQQLFQTWHADWVAEDPSFNPSTAGLALKVITAKPTALSTPPQEIAKSSPPPSPSISAPKEKKLKKAKKKKVKARPSQSSQPTDNQTEHPALKYLTTYHSSHETWKFSKPHQNHLLRHLFSLTHIPSLYDPALLAYLCGLEGTSARSRIRQQALAIRTEDAEWLASEPTNADTMENETHEQCVERRRRDYEAAVARVKERLRAQEDEREEREWETLGGRDEWEWKLKKRRRAEVVLWGVGEEDVVQEVAAPPQRPIIPLVAGVGGGGQDVPQGRGRGMGGVEEISGSGIARGSQAKKIVFGDDDGVQTNGPQKVHGIQKMSGKYGVGEGQVKRKRKRKRRTTGVPDDDSSSDSSSSSSSSESEAEKVDGQKMAGKQQAKAKEGWIEMERSRPGSVSSSDSESGSE